MDPSVLSPHHNPPSRPYAGSTNLQDAPIVSEQAPTDSSTQTTRTCSRGHIHSGWPASGPVAIEKREKYCWYCGLVVKNDAATLRKHVVQMHKHKQQMPIEIEGSTSGRSKRTAVSNDTSQPQVSRKSEESKPLPSRQQDPLLLTEIKRLREARENNLATIAQLRNLYDGVGITIGDLYRDITSQEIWLATLAALLALVKALRVIPNRVADCCWNITNYRQHVTRIAFHFTLDHVRIQAKMEVRKDQGAGLVCAQQVGLTDQCWFTMSRRVRELPHDARDANGCLIRSHAQHQRRDVLGSGFWEAWSAKMATEGLEVLRREICTLFTSLCWSGLTLGTRRREAGGTQRLLDIARMVFEIFHDVLARNERLASPHMRTVRVVSDESPPLPLTFPYLFTDRTLEMMRQGAWNRSPV